MIHLDRLWGRPRSVKISGKPHRVPFGVSLPSRLSDPIRKWIRDSGLVYAVKRVKKLKVWAIHILAQDRNFSFPWFSTKVYKGYVVPKLDLFEYLVDNLRDLRKVRLILTLLNSHKQVVIGEPSLSSVTDVPTPQDTSKYADKLRLYARLPQVPDSALESTLAVNTRTKFCRNFGHTFSGPIGRLDLDFPAEERLYWEEEMESPGCLGRVVAIPDKGKFRNILIGHWAIQLKTKCLADWLRKWLWSLPQIASGDQGKFSDFIIKSLKERRFMLSIDLSEATDRLDRKVQIELLHLMGVPKGFLSFLELPFYYQAEMFGKGKGLRKGKYAAGQPMGLYLSFPMFELLHYVVLRFVTAISETADFRICGDDLVIACEPSEADEIYSRYTNLIERFGGVISEEKTLKSSRAAEGVGALFLSGYPKEIRIPSGRLSTLEAHTPGTWLHQAIQEQTPLARSIHSVWLETKLEKRYTYDQRREANLDLVISDLSEWDVDALRQLVSPDNTPLTYPIWDDDQYHFWRKSPDRDTKDLPYRWISQYRYQEALTDHKIVRLYKKGPTNE